MVVMLGRDRINGCSILALIDASSTYYASPSPARPAIPAPSSSTLLDHLVE